MCPKQRGVTSKPRSYMQVAIPMSIVTSIVKIMEPLGYRNVSEFVNEAVRAHVRYKMTEYDRTVLE